MCHVFPGLSAHVLTGWGEMRVGRSFARDHSQWRSAENQESVLSRQRGLTRRSRRGPTASHQARATGTQYIICGPGLASCRRPRLTSNVRPHRKRSAPCQSSAKNTVPRKKHLSANISYLNRSSFGAHASHRKRTRVLMPGACSAMSIFKTKASGTNRTKAEYQSSSSAKAAMRDCAWAIPRAERECGHALTHA